MDSIVTWTTRLQKKSKKFSRSCSKGGRIPNGQSVAGKKVFITGVSSGIGRTLVNEFIDQGAIVMGIARRIEMLEKLSLKYPQENFSYLKCDVAKKENVNRALQYMDERNFVPDIVIFNAGVNNPDLVPDFSFRGFNDNLKTNLAGVLVWLEPLLLRMKNQGSGQFIAISSMSAYLAQSNGVGYSTSKAALTMAFQCLNKKYRFEDFLFNVFNLGPVNTDMWKKGNLPFLLSKKKVARKIISSVGSNKGTINYPSYLVFLARVLNFFPNIHILK